jgi:hypothetical protein
MSTKAKLTSNYTNPISVLIRAFGDLAEKNSISSRETNRFTELIKETLADHITLKDPDRPKTPSAYMIYAQKYREDVSAEVLKKHPELANNKKALSVAVTKAIAERWNSSKNQAKYKEQAAHLKTVAEEYDNTHKKSVDELLKYACNNPRTRGSRSSASKSSRDDKPKSTPSARMLWKKSLSDSEKSDLKAKAEKLGLSLDEMWAHTDAKTRERFTAQAKSLKEEAVAKFNEARASKNEENEGEEEEEKSTKRTSPRRSPSPKRNSSPRRSSPDRRASPSPAPKKKKTETKQISSDAEDEEIDFDAIIANAQRNTNSKSKSKSPSTSSSGLQLSGTKPSTKKKLMDDSDTEDE